MAHACSEVKSLTRFWPNTMSAQEKPIYAEPPRKQHTLGVWPVPEVNAH